jgi:hypothetical protein
MGCNKSYGQRLYNEISTLSTSNSSLRNGLTLQVDWFMLCGEIPYEDFSCRGFKGNTYYNLAEKPEIVAFFDIKSETAKLPAILHSMFDGAATRGEAWTRQDWLCRNCVYSFLDRHKMDWWLDRK